MNRHVAKFFSVFFFIILISGCAQTDDFPVYDQVLVYDKPYDYTYLRVLEAMESFPEWVLEETEKSEGIVIVRNTQYGHIFDRDKWTVRLNIKSLGRKQTSVSIDPSTQKNEKGGELLNRIDELMHQSNVKGNTGEPIAV